MIEETAETQLLQVQKKDEKKVKLNGKNKIKTMPNGAPRYLAKIEYLVIVLNIAIMIPQCFS